MRVRLSETSDIMITLRRSSRARRMTLRVSRGDGTVTLTLPPRASERAGLDFARAKTAWIANQLKSIAPEQRIGPGLAVPLRDVLHPVLAWPGLRGARLGQGVIEAPETDAGRHVEALLRREARRDIADRARHYAARLKRPFDRIVISDTRSRWGSCSSAGRLMFSFRLIMAPPYVLDYVVAHEVAHLAEMNHSPRFWAVCSDIFGDVSTPRDWLRRHGSDLHRFSFREPA